MRDSGEQGFAKLGNLSEAWKGPGRVNPERSCEKRRVCVLSDTPLEQPES